MNVTDHIQTFEQILDYRIGAGSDAAISIKKDQVASFYVDILGLFNHPETFDGPSFYKYPLPLVLHYLKRAHIHYLGKNLLELEQAINGIARRLPELTELKTSLQRFFSSFKKDLTRHIEDEEELLFPYIESLWKAQTKGMASIDIVQKLKLMDYMLEHSDAQEKDLSDLVRSLEHLNDYIKDSFAFKMLVNRMKLFELDLRIHGKIEDEVLVPLAIDLEKKILKRL